MGDAGIKSSIQGSNVPNPDEAVPSFVPGAMAKAGKGLLEGTLQAGTSAASDKLLDLVGLGGKSAADKGKDTRDYLAAAFPELNAWERAGADDHEYPFLYQRQTCHQVQPNQATYQKRQKCQPATYLQEVLYQIGRASCRERV